MQAFQKNSKFSINACFEKKKLEEGRCVREVSREFEPWIFLVTTYFGEIIIFVVSKDQTFRIRCTLVNPEQFLILVTHLVVSFKLFNKYSK
jgi:hypothetical protein